MSLNNKLQRIVLDLEDLIELVSDTEVVDKLTKIKEELQETDLYDEI